jgi:hypothetical protein
MSIEEGTEKKRKGVKKEKGEERKRNLLKFKAVHLYNCSLLFHRESPGWTEKNGLSIATKDVFS